MSKQRARTTWVLAWWSLQLLAPALHLGETAGDLGRATPQVVASCSADGPCQNPDHRHRAPHDHEQCEVCKFRPAAPPNDQQAALVGWSNEARVHVPSSSESPGSLTLLLPKARAPPGA